MAKLKQSLRNVQKSIQTFLNFVVGREETVKVEEAIPTQRNQYFT